MIAKSKEAISLLSAVTVLGGMVGVVVGLHKKIKGNPAIHFIGGAAITFGVIYGGVKFIKWVSTDDTSTKP